MKKRTTIFWIAPSALLVWALTGCEPTDRVVENVRTVDWYATHDVEPAEQLAKCMTNPPLLDATPDCVNASRAENRVKASTTWGTESEGVRTTPPLPVKDGNRQ